MNDLNAEGSSADAEPHVIGRVGPGTGATAAITWSDPLEFEEMSH